MMKRQIWECILMCQIWLNQLMSSKKSPSIDQILRKQETLRMASQLRKLIKRLQTKLRLALRITPTVGRSLAMKILLQASTQNFRPRMALWALSASTLKRQPFLKMSTFSEVRLNKRKSRRREAMRCQLLRWERWVAAT